MTSVLTLPPTLDGAEDPGDLLPHQVRGARRYSLNRALRRLIAGRRPDGIEAETSAELAHRHGRASVESGMYFPSDATSRAPSQAWSSTSLKGGRGPRGPDSVIGRPPVLRGPPGRA
jgi:hypothetical protein